MDKSFLSVEYWRIALVLFIAVVVGIQSGFWLASLTLSLFGYIIWLLYKIYILYQWLEKGAKPSQLPDNNGLFEGVTQQVLKMRRLNTSRKKNMRKLLERSRMIVTGLPYAALVLNRKNEIDWANKTANEFLNIDIKRDRSQRIDNLIRLPEFQELLTKKTRCEIELTFPQSNRQLSILLTPVQKNYKLLIASDISERTYIMQMRKNFIANASHELRTPLTVIAGYLEILHQDESLTLDQQTSVISASEQAARMQLIIDDLLTLSILENSELSDEATIIINVPNVLQNICHDSSALITDESHILKIIADNALKIKGIETEIFSVCNNLIQNAIRHTPAGTNISVEWQKTPTGEACLTIKDNGQGISAEHISHLTERFYRVDKGRSREKGGTGLGLAIVQHIIQRHGGEMDIQSAIGRGSSFKVCFPSERVIWEEPVDL